MRIQHNIAALNSHRNLGINNAFTGKNLEKLSSGYRINRAGDDAAGLAISEKMRGQIRGLAMAEQNTSNGINLIQTAEGGLNETHAILQRMRELAVQSSNGTYDEEVDRVNLEFEFQEIKSEIDRIASSTHYNGIKLLDGSLGSSNRIPNVIGIKNSGETISQTPYAGSKVAQAATTAPVLVGMAGNSDYTVELTYRDKDDQLQSVSFTVNTANLTDYITEMQKLVDAHFADDGVKVTVGGTLSATAGLTFKMDGAENGESNFRLVEIRTTAGTSSMVTQAGGAWTAGVNPSNDLSATLLTGAKYLEVDGKKFQFVVNPEDVTELGVIAIIVDAGDLDANGQLQAAGVDAASLSSLAAQLKQHGINAAVDSAGTKLSFFANGGQGLIFQIGANGGADQRVSLNVNAMDSKSIGIVDASGKLTTSLASASIATRDSANNAIDIITGATNMVSLQRAGLGALQNRLEHTMNNLGVTKENLTASESTIRDVDMAKEMMEFTKNQILVQASQAMLAQANQLPQGVLSLLR